MNIKFNTLRLTVILLTAFASCNDHDDDNQQNSIVGRWKVETKEHVCPDPADNSTYPDNTVWEFRADATYAVYGSNSTTPIFEATYERPNANIIYLCHAGDCSSSYNVILPGEKLILEETEAMDFDCILRYTFVKQ